MDFVLLKDVLVADIAAAEATRDRNDRVVLGVRTPRLLQEPLRLQLHRLFRVDDDVGGGLVVGVDVEGDDLPAVRDEVLDHCLAKGAISSEDQTFAVHIVNNL